MTFTPDEAADLCALFLTDCKKDTDGTGALVRRVEWDGECFLFITDNQRQHYRPLPAGEVSGVQRVKMQLVTISPLE